MPDVTLSSPVDTFLRSANTSEMMTNLGADAWLSARSVRIDQPEAIDSTEKLRHHQNAESYLAPKAVVLTDGTTLTSSTAFGRLFRVTAPATVNVPASIGDDAGMFEAIVDDVLTLAFDAGSTVNGTTLAKARFEGANITLIATEPGAHANGWDLDLVDDGVANVGDNTTVDTASKTVTIYFDSGNATHDLAALKDFIDNDGIVSSPFSAITLDAAGSTAIPEASLTSSGGAGPEKGEYSFQPTSRVQVRAFDGDFYLTVTPIASEGPRDARHYLRSAQSLDGNLSRGGTVVIGPDELGNSVLITAGSTIELPNPALYPGERVQLVPGFGAASAFTGSYLPIHRGKTGDLLSSIDDDRGDVTLEAVAGGWVADARYLRANGTGSNDYETFRNNTGSAGLTDANTFADDQTWNGTDNTAPNQTAASDASVMTRGLVEAWSGKMPAAKISSNISLNDTESHDLDLDLGAYGLDVTANRTVLLVIASALDTTAQQRTYGAMWFAYFREGSSANFAALELHSGKVRGDANADLSFALSHPSGTSTLRLTATQSGSTTGYSNLTLHALILGDNQ